MGVKKPAWEQAAEELVRQVSNLLADHGDTIEKALRKAIGKDAARAQVRQLESLMEALDLELWRKASTPNTRIAGHLAAALRFVAVGVAGSAVTLATTSAYQALMDVDSKANEVVECVIQYSDKLDTATSRTPADDPLNSLNSLESDPYDPDRTRAARSRWIQSVSANPASSVGRSAAPQDRSIVESAFEDLTRGGQVGYDGHGTYYPTLDGIAKAASLTPEQVLYSLMEGSRGERREQVLRAALSASQGRADR